MTSWALIPIKARAQCKSRLTRVLTQRARIALARDMLRHVVEIVSQAPGIDKIAVVSPERDELPESVTLLPDACGGLNLALESATASLFAQGATSILVILGDLPRLGIEDVERLRACCARGILGLAPDRSGRGTNAVALPAGVPFRFKFGPESFAAHVAQAEALRQPFEIIRTQGLELDIDGPDDLALWHSQFENPTYPARSSAS